MKLKQKYIFNKETLLYEIKTITLRERMSRGVVLFILSIAAAFGYFMIYTGYFAEDTPRVMALKQESVKLRSRLDILDKRLDEDGRILQTLQMRDNKVYRPIFGMAEIPQDIRDAGFGGVDRYGYLSEAPHSAFLVNLEKKTDILYKKTFVQSVSLKEVSSLAKRTGEMVSCVPAIPPVQINDIRFSSGFGYRKDPFNGRLKFHCGMDFAGKKGEPIYVTGNGKVESVAYNFFGYGREIVIDHGFGYKTRYAHLSKALVHAGQTVSRGDVIALMGNTGRSTGTHLHYEVIYRNSPVNPVNYFSKDLKGEQYLSMIRTLGEASD
ncbi:MAG: M23 family metallopeptidase [Bacteroidales bacterium]|jgi:murein DD-endopeptidase MepM/ murein hydrolase activator NlpD|nr:M23 family metallopeptidase [Bacteroidales bacterium]